VIYWSRRSTGGYLRWPTNLH